MDNYAASASRLRYAWGIEPKAADYLLRMYVRPNHVAEHRHLPAKSKDARRTVINHLRRKVGNIITFPGHGYGLPPEVAEVIREVIGW